jgi:hypothetical protein
VQTFGSAVTGALIAASLVLAVDSQSSAQTVSNTVTGAVTFYRDVLPILQNRCQNCHRLGEIGPMPLGSFDEARPYARAIKQAVISKKMPPWNVAAEPGKFHNDPSLSARELEILAAWADTGAAAGNTQDAPPPRTFAPGWTIGTPDAVFEAQPYDVPTSGTIEYTYLIVSTGFTEDRWMSAAEVRPGNRSVMHHANVYVREPDSTWLRNYPKGEWFVPGERGQRFGLGGSSSAGASAREQMIAGYIPGRPARQVPDGYGMLVPAGSDIIFQMHYTTNGTPAKDQTKIGFVFAKSRPGKRVIRIQASNADFVIPPGASSHPVSGTALLGVECELIDAYPHMHFRGKSMALSAVFPAGRDEPLVNVPRYDFNWQLVYEFNSRMTLPKGTLLKADATFDNSPANRMNPDPKSSVRWGDQSWEEMMVGFFDVAVPPDTDLRAVVVPASRPAR